ncbi:MAG: zinc ribbon domain-containing protein [Phycisphaeraceae bacterium]|nr:zinc ribbon domain-containing protein [Phycisphaeraceae bacterium]
MPTYDYKCNACKHRFELFQSMKDAPKRKCPKCAKNTLERLIGTGAAILFKGSGFYETDYRSETYKKAADAEKAPAPSDTKAESKPDAKSDAKPDSKSDTKSESNKSESKSDPKSSPAKIDKQSASKSSSKLASRSSKRRSSSK